MSNLCYNIGFVSTDIEAGDETTPENHKSAPPGLPAIMEIKEKRCVDRQMAEAKGASMFPEFIREAMTPLPELSPLDLVQ